MDSLSGLCFKYGTQAFINVAIKWMCSQDWRSIRVCTMTALKNVAVYHNREFDRAFHVTDAGGENWGTQVQSFFKNISKYIF